MVSCGIARYKNVNKQKNDERKHKIELGIGEGRNNRSDHNLIEWECRFTLGLNAATNTNYIKNNKNCSELNFL